MNVFTSMTDEEFINVVRTLVVDQPEWVAEMLERFETALDLELELCPKCGSTLDI